MRPLEITIGIHPADLAPWNGAEVPVRFIFTETGVEVCFPKLLNLTPEVLDRLRAEFPLIKTSLSPRSREIMWSLLQTSEGMATREELIDQVWTENVPTWSCVRKAVHVLNKKLAQMKYGYIIRGSRKGVYRLRPLG